MKILVTGGAGYIGSHTCVELLNAGHDIVMVDNLSNSSEKSIDRVKEITRKDFEFYKCDILDYDGLTKVFDENKFDSVIHFAGFKAVGESCEKPIEYYHNNMTGTFILLRVMKEHGVKNIVFSSSATVYGIPESVPIKEDAPLFAINPYGSTKLMLERALSDVQSADKEMSVVLLRYFNPIGAHESGMIGEDPNGIPNNLLPYVAQVAVGRLPKVNVFGNNYPTPDGTGVRDYIHITDLALGHLKAVEKKTGVSGVHIYNLGTGQGYSVLEIIKAFGKAAGKEIPYEIAPNRPGDAAICYADATKAKEELGWRAERGIEKMCADAWNWQSKNPDGYR
ncbi:MAG: UDP-glucose 4-epimerase GalE [Clostridia bacterium]|nr:UDP-glucose 4-epimerase GalE [Clostridia bacterium]